MVRRKELIFREISVGIFACLGNGFTGIKLAKKPVLLHYGLILQEVTCKDYFVGILALLKVSFYIGMALVYLNVLNLYQLVIKMASSSAIILAQQLDNFCIGMALA